MARDRNASPDSQSTSTLEELRAARLAKVEQLHQVGQLAYAYRWETTHHAAALQAQYTDLANGEGVDTVVAIGGRIMARRVFGKLAFFGLPVSSCSIQIYL
jgi:lysyl-tRNA synthetase, class II